MLLKQSKEDRDYWADALGLSPLEVACIDEGAPRGWGLLVFGSARVPIKGEFPTDNHLYELFSTDPNEWAEKKAREALEAAKHGGVTEDFAPQDEFRRRKRVRACPVRTCANASRTPAAAPKRTNAAESACCRSMP